MVAVARGSNFSQRHAVSDRRRHEREEEPGVWRPADIEQPWWPSIETVRSASVHDADGQRIRSSVGPTFRKTS
jgi:hypothetical protein